MGKIGTDYKGTFAQHRGTNSSSGGDGCFANAAFPKVENDAHTSPYLPIVNSYYQTTCKMSWLQMLVITMYVDCPLMVIFSSCVYTKVSNGTGGWVSCA